MSNPTDDDMKRIVLTFEHHREAIDGLAAKTQAAIDETASALRGHLELIEGLHHYIDALTLVNRTLVSLVFGRRRLDPDHVFGIVSSMADNPIALEHARRILGARPRFRVIEGGKSDSGADAFANAAPAATRAR
ncbi:hypothetical protein [Methylosinus sp. KRF6]|uniref:hypothetical protein n=1 Tax=Methylosinus sp. KRF6 TaxID=2846853 RepID=UPI001C0C52CF|nr:hypothetical protein [Methylosinus sp. KRF6]MBU3887204.1 hypothetical protein [Methylosinus sp. KRF6]